MLQPQVNWLLPGMTPGWMPAPGDVITPPVDVLESKDEIIYIFAIPGVGSEEVRVEIQQQALEVEAGLPQLQDGNQYTYRYRERPVGRYYRLVTLPPEIDTEKAVASFNQGLLQVRFPKTFRGRQIKVNVKTPVQKKTKSTLADKDDPAERTHLI